MARRPIPAAPGVASDAAPRDAALPAARFLLDDAAPLLGAALAVEGATVDSVERRQVVHRPGRSLVVRYRVVVRTRSGGHRTENLVAVADRHGPPAGSLVLEAGDLAVGVYRYPHDPALPALAPLADPATAGALAGLPGPVSVEVRTYRPLERAVVRVAGDDGVVRYAKALPPAELLDAADRHRRLPPDLPGPAVVTADAEVGLLVLDAVPGTALRDDLATGDGPLPAPAQLLAVLDRLGDAPVTTAVGRRPPIGAAAGHAALLGHVLPRQRRRIRRLLDRIGPDEATSSRVVHGDLHPAQVLVTGGEISGLIDLDDVGLGAPVDDLASFLGHLSTLALERNLPRARLLLGSFLPAAEAVVDPAELHRRTAAVVLGLATGPYRVQQAGWSDGTRRRLELAERWATGDVRTLRMAS